MTSKYRFLRSTLALCKQLSVAAFAVIVLIAAPVAGNAQETTTAIRGSVLAPDGGPAAGAAVRIVDTRTGTARSTTTSDSGQFSMSGLRVGGPYTVEVAAEGLASQSITDIDLVLGDTYTFTVTLSPAQIEEIVVTASTLRTVQVAMGPSATFSLTDLQDAPAFNRNINDVIAIDPRIYVDEAFVDSVQCGGANSRFNALTVDGVRLSDNFGLNSNGYPTERMPFSYDAIEQVAVELAPFDVMYGGFTACNINAVTKSGTNEFHGAVFVDYYDDSFVGDTLEGDKLDLGKYDQTRYGVNFGGPIIKDKLFFFAAYEKLEGVNVFDRGPADASVGTPVLGVTQTQLDRIAQIARDVYGYDAGGTPPSLANEDEKLLLKFDWEINDSHRAAYTYTYNDGFNNNESDGDSNEFEFLNHLYERGAELNSHVGQLFSNWTENFNTELRIGFTDLDNRQIPLGGTDFGEVQIVTFNDPDGAGPISSQRATVYLGADDSRHANKLAYETTNFKLAGNYTMGDHVITAGYEMESIDIFNMFIQEAEGEYRFDSSAFCGSANPDGCIDAFEQGNPSRITYENAAPSNIPSDAAASFSYDINTFYIQDEFTLADGALSIVAGVRYDWYSSSDVPRENPNFEARNGYTNQQNFDGESVLQPRLGVTWDYSDALTFRGGVGLYSGGNPNVWLSNNYSNDGITQVEFQDRTLDDNGIGGSPNLFTLSWTGDGNPIFDIPQNLYDSVASGASNGGVNAVDPTFKIPTEWKFALGVTWDFDAGFMGDGYSLMLDYLHNEQNDAAIIVDATLEQIGTAPDGRPLYRSINRADPDCVDPTSPACGNRNFNQDFILSNITGADGKADVWSLSLSKSHDWGLDWTFGYAYTDSEDVNPMTSSVAFSNYVNVAVSDPNNPGPARSNYNVRHRFTLRMNYRDTFFGDYETKFTLFGRVNEGVPYSPTFVDGGFTFGDTLDDRHLLYIPSGINDPNVVFGPGFDTDAFFAYLNDSGLSGYGGRIAPRNSLTSAWWQKFDLKIEQELPGFRPDDRFSAFLVIENFGNLLNDDWGVLKEQSFPRSLPMVDFSIDTVNNQYVYEEFFTPAPQARVADASLWKLIFGVTYNF